MILIRHMAPLALSLALCAAPVSAQLVVGVDNAAVPIQLIDVETGVATPLFSGIEAWGLAADDAGRNLYVASGQQLYRASYDSLTPTLVGTFMLGAGPVTFTGLAFNPADGFLYASRTAGGQGAEGLYRVDPSTGVSELTFALSPAADWDIGGIEFDVSDGTLYGLSDGSVSIVRGLYSIDLDAETLDFVAGYPGPEDDIDGLAIGDGKAYFVNDEPGEILVYDFTNEMFGASLTSPWVAGHVFSGATWAPGIPSAGAMALFAAAGMLVSAARPSRAAAGSALGRQCAPVLAVRS